MSRELSLLVSYMTNFEPKIKINNIAVPIWLWICEMLKKVLNSKRILLVEVYSFNLVVEKIFH